MSLCRGRRSGSGTGPAFRRAALRWRDAAKGYRRISLKRLILSTPVLEWWAGS